MAMTHTNPTTTPESAASAHKDPVPGPAQDTKSTAVRLSVNLAPGVARTLKQIADERGVTVTEEIRRAIALDQIVTQALNEGHRVTVVEGHGAQAKFRDLVFL